MIKASEALEISKKKAEEFPDYVDKFLDKCIKNAANNGIRVTTISFDDFEALVFPDEMIEKVYKWLHRNMKIAMNKLKENGYLVDYDTFTNILTISWYE